MHNRLTLKKMFSFKAPEATEGDEDGRPEENEGTHNGEKIRKYWHEKLGANECPLLKVDQFVSKKLKIIMDKPDGKAKYYVYTKFKENGLEEEEDDETEDETCSKSSIAPYGIYVPIMETTSNDVEYEQIVVHWDPRISVRDNFNGDHYLINDNSENIVHLNCIVLQIGFGTAKEEEERSDMLKQLSSSAMGFKWNKKSKKKFDKATISEKDVFILNKKRRLEFFTWRQIKKKRKVLNYLDECLSVYFQMYPKDFGHFYTDVL